MKRAGKKIALLSGDGIGPEVIRESVKVLDTLSSNSDINFSYYDAPIGAEAIDKYGNPYDEISYDSDGNMAINWGVYGVPETFIINKNGIIILRHPGPITTNVLKNEIMPILDEISL